MAPKRPLAARLPWQTPTAEDSAAVTSGVPPVTPEVDAVLIQIFALVSEAIAGATHSLLSGDREAAKALVAADEQVDELTHEVTLLVESSLAESGRSADERRHLISVLRMLPDLERNGDLAEHIARRAARGLGQEISPRSRGLIERMGEVATTIWRETADLLSREGSVAEAGAIEYLDDELDDLHVTVIAEAVSGSMGLPVAIELAMVARFYERFGDHAVNLARRVAIESGSAGEPTTRGAD